MSLKKLGCGAMLVGALAFFGSFAVFGTAIMRAVDAHRVATLPLTVGVTSTTGPITVDTGKLCLVGFELHVHSDVGRPVDDASGETKFAAPYDFPISYTVLDQDGREIVSFSDNIVWSEVPDSNFTAEGGDVKFTRTWPTQKFEVQPPGEIRVVAEIAPDTKYGAEARSANLIVWDNVSLQTGFVLGGLALLYTGPVVFIGGLALLIIGLVTGRDRPAG